jgi:alkylhydroperoxidase family enzyme
MTPRIPPGGRDEIGRVNWALVRVVGLGARTTNPPRLFATLARHRRIFRPWLRFAGRLMPGGKLARADAELVILRVATLCGSAYEWSHHERIGRRAGLSPETIAAVHDPGSWPAWTPRQQAILTAVDELVATRALGDATWSALVAAGLTEPQLIELPMLTGHYVMLAMTLNALQVEPDGFKRPSSAPPTAP